MESGCCRPLETPFGVVGVGSRAHLVGVFDDILVGVFTKVEKHTTSQASVEMHLQPETSNMLEQIGTDWEWSVHALDYRELQAIRWCCVGEDDVDCGQDCTPSDGDQRDVVLESG